MTGERWLDKKGLAEHLSCSVRSVETALAKGCPHARIFGRPKFRPSIVEPWLEEAGYLVRVDDGCTVVTGSNETGPAGNRPLTTGGDVSNGC